MPEYLAPGVFAEFAPGGPRPIEGVGTTMTAFVGFAAAGPINEPTLITSWEQYVKTFGGLEEGGIRNGFLEGAYLGYSLYGFFDNGGRRCYVVRLPHIASESPAGQSTKALMAQAPSRASKAVPSLTFQPKGNPQSDIVIEVASPTNDDAGEGAFNLKITVDGVEEAYENLILGKPAKGGKGRNVAEAVQTSTVISVTVEEKAATGTLAERAPELGMYYIKANTSMELAQVQPNTFIGNVDDRSGVQGLEVIQEVNIISVPDLMSMYEKGLLDKEGVKAVQLALIAHCERVGNRVAILDTIPNLKPQQTLKWRQKETNFDSSFATMYYPWIKIMGKDGKPINVPPSGHIAGVWARSDNERGVHKAPANEVIRGVLSPAYEITNGEQEVLNPEGVNCIRTFTSRGVRVWGARTLSSDARYRYLNVRRLFNYVAESLQKGTQWSVFEPNNVDTWIRLRRDITAFLIGVWREGALFGTTPEKAFYVKIDEQNNPEDMRDRGIMTVDIGMSPVKPAEFVRLRFHHKTEDE
jgi:uncharacterized protein